MTDAFIDALTRHLGAQKVLTDTTILNQRRHDYWVLSHLDDLQDRPAPRPRCVVQPQTVDDVVATVNACRDAQVAIVPFGLGSGVCGGVLGHPDRVLLDLSSLHATRHIDPVNLLATFDAGKRGSEAEAEVAALDLTIGHWPQSIAVSSVGGWIATRASGQFSTANGNIEDLVYSIEAVLADGSVVHAGKAPRASSGPDLRHLLLGSEGTLGIITGVTLSVRRKPEAQDYSAFATTSMQQGFDFQRELIQRGWSAAGDTSIRSGRGATFVRRTGPRRPRHADHGARGPDRTGRRRTGRKRPTRTQNGLAWRCNDCDHAMARSSQYGSALAFVPRKTHRRRHCRSGGTMGSDWRDLLGCHRCTERCTRHAQCVRAQLSRVPIGTQLVFFVRGATGGFGRHGTPLPNVLATNHRDHGRTGGRHRSSPWYRARPRAVPAPRSRRHRHRDAAQNQSSARSNRHHESGCAAERCLRPFSQSTRAPRAFVRWWSIPN